MRDRCHHKELTFRGRIAFFRPCAKIGFGKNTIWVIRKHLNQRAVLKGKTLLKRKLMLLETETSTPSPSKTRSRARPAAGLAGFTVFTTTCTCARACAELPEAFIGASTPAETASSQLTPLWPHL